MARKSIKTLRSRSQEIEEVIDIDEIPQCNGGQQTLPSFGEEKERGRDEYGSDEK